MCINRQGLVTVAHLSDEIPADVITEHKAIMRICCYLPYNDIFPTGNKQKVVYLFSLSILSYSMIITAVEGRCGGGTEGCTSWFGQAVHFTATWQISLASVRAQLGPSTLKGDLTPLLTLTAQTQGGLPSFWFFIAQGLLLLCCSIVRTWLIFIFKERACLILHSAAWVWMDVCSQIDEHCLKWCSQSWENTIRLLANMHITSTLST